MDGIWIWLLGALLACLGAGAWALRSRRRDAARRASALQQAQALAQRQAAAEGERRAAAERAAQQAATEAARVEAAARAEAARIERARAEAARSEAARLAAAQTERQLAARAAAERAALQSARDAAHSRMREQAAQAAQIAQAAQQQAPAPSPAPPSHRRAAPLVMVADDSKTVRVKTGRLLAQHGFEVVFAVDGQDAAQQLQRLEPDLLITDVEMPGLDGFELTRRVRTDPRTAHLPVIMITSADDKHRGEADRAGVSVLLGKPYAEEALVAHARRATQALATVASAPA